MPPVRASLEGPFARSVREALESVASPELVERVVAMSLSAARRTAIPEDIPPFTAFVEGPLRNVVVQQLGHAEYEVVSERIAHVLHMATSQIGGRNPTSPSATHAVVSADVEGEYWEEDSQVRLSSGASSERAELELELDEPAFRMPAPDPREPERVTIPERTSSPAASPSGGRAIGRILTPGPRPAARAKTPDTLRPPAAAPACVIVLSLDPMLVIETESRMRESRVLCIDSTEALLAATSRARGRVAIVLDTALPSIDVPTVAALAGAFPATTTVVLWGMSERQKDRLVSMFPIASAWIAGGVAASPADVLTQAK
jgi:hypothetical protein